MMTVELAMCRKQISIPLRLGNTKSKMRNFALHTSRFSIAEFIL